MKSEEVEHEDEHDAAEDEGEEDGEEEIEAVDGVDDEDAPMSKRSKMAESPGKGSAYVNPSVFVAEQRGAEMAVEKYTKDLREQLEVLKNWILWVSGLPA